MGKVGGEDDFYPAGIRYWAQHYEYSKPKIQVYRCIGMSSITPGLYIFETVRPPKTILLKEWKQLNENGFKPFYLPIEKLRKKL